MIIFVSKEDYRSFGFSPDLWSGNTLRIEVPDDFSGGGKTYDPDTETWIPDPPYEPTAADIAREHELRRSDLLAESATVTADWRIEALDDSISDDDRVKLKAWIDYNKLVRDASVGEDWPQKPE